VAHCSVICCLRNGYRLFGDLKAEDEWFVGYFKWLYQLECFSNKLAKRQVMVV